MLSSFFFYVLINAFANIHPVETPTKNKSTRIKANIVFNVLANVSILLLVDHLDVGYRVVGVRGNDPNFKVAVFSWLGVDASHVRYVQFFFYHLLSFLFPASGKLQRPCPI